MLESPDLNCSPVRLVERTDLEIVTEDLRLRPLAEGDADVIQQLAGDERIADTTASIPHPYPEGEASRWIADTLVRRQAGTDLALAIVDKTNDEVLGCISLMRMAQGRAELGYWVGVPYWGRGIATAAVQALVSCAPAEFGLQCIEARVLVRNPASARVLLRAGFRLRETSVSQCGYRQQQEPTEFYELHCDAHAPRR